MKHWMIALAVVLAAAGTRAAEPMSFGGAVSPIFKEKCTGCHGAEKQKGGLRLDSHEAVLKGGENGPAVVAGDPAKSPLYQAITLGKDKDGHMPPPKKAQLTEDEIAKIKAWIEKGAPGEA
jgi:mono/diheme cytochrome c family protein